MKDAEILQSQLKRHFFDVKIHEGLRNSATSRINKFHSDIAIEDVKSIKDAEILQSVT